MKEVDQQYKIRHSLAHLLAKAVTEIYPDAQPTIGPPTDNGFYYDFGDLELSENDLPKIEKRMRKILATWKTFQKIDVDSKYAKDFFKGNTFKQELIKGIESEDQDITLYYSGPTVENLNLGTELPNTAFVDLCRGGHVENPSTEIDPKAFKLDSLAGAYWRGNENNQMLTRIYGLAFETPEELEQFVEQREEAKKRDHRKLGLQLGLFTFSDLVGKGLPMFLPSGNLVRQTLSNYITQEKEKLGYKFVHIPHIAKRELYEVSGHMGKYDAMMPTMVDEEGEEYVMKAMNCPHHFELYNSQLHSYRDLPLRYAENTTVYRNEKSGELHGLTRVKALTQDDTHHFVRHDQIADELNMVFDLLDRVYKKFKFNSYKLEVSVRDPQNKDKYFGDDALWSQTESFLEKAVKERGVDYSIEEGEAAFYGPKIDIKVNDSLGRPWQLATIQLDFIQPENFDMTYIDSNGQKQRPAVLHVAIFGSIERFMGILIEHFAGKFPLWLSPVQISLIPVAETHAEFATNIKAQLEQSGFRVELLTDDSLGKRIRQSKTDFVPYYAVIGDKEIESGELTLEGRDYEKVSGSIDNLISQLKDKL